MLKIIKFWAPRCGPCQRLKIEFNKFKKEYENKNIEFNEVNIDKEDGQKKAKKYNVRSIPTILFIQNKEVKERFVGNNINIIKKKVKEFI